MAKTTASSRGATTTAGKRSAREASKSSGASVAAHRDADLWRRIQADLSWHQRTGPGVTEARKRYLRQPQLLEVINERAGFYLYYIVEEVERRGLPIELALLPVLESKLDPFATSVSRAAGMWQIMPATGEHLGLQQDWWFDGRRDLRTSTAAALDYLESLHADLGEDWLLAMAAYNAGKGRVLAAMAANERKGKPTDYWSLSLPEETRRFVPRLIALTQIFADPQAYGLELPQLADAPAFTPVQTGGQIELARAAQLAGIELATLRALNPGQLRWATAPAGPQELLLPPGSAEAFAAALAELPAEDRVRWQHYRIRRGDSLGVIARRFNTEVGTLRAANQIRGSMIRAGDTLLIPSGGDWAGSLAASDDPGLSRKGYRVRRGDSLYRIANRFRVSIDDIIDWNSLEPDAYLHPGQQLTLFVEGD